MGNASSRRRERGGGARPAVVTRRGLIGGSVGAAMLVALPRTPARAGQAAAPARAGLPASGQAPAGQAPAGRPVLIFGISDPGLSPGESVQLVRPSSAVPVASRLAALPVQSPDGEALALVSVNETVPASVTVSIVASATAKLLQRATIAVPGTPEGALILATPVFTADSGTVALVVSVTVPSGASTISKHNPNTGQPMPVSTATWTSHHELAYLDRATGSVTGPVSLGDAPSLARVSAVADSRDLFLWTVADATAVKPSAAFKKNPVPRPVTRFSAYRAGQGSARFSVAAPGPWPVSGEPVMVLRNGAIARLGYGHTLEVYSPETGRAEEFRMAELARPSAKPGAPFMQSLPDGSLLIANPAVGRAVIADPARSYRPVTTVSYPPPRWPASAPSSKAAVSPDGRTLYVLGSARSGGLAAYDLSTGAVVAAYSDGSHYTGLYQLGDGTILATSGTSPRLDFFTPSLAAAGSAASDLHVVAVF